MLRVGLTGGIGSGPGVLGEDGSLDRVKLAGIVIDNWGTLADLDRRVAQVGADLHSRVTR